MTTPPPPPPPQHPAVNNCSQGGNRDRVGGGQRTTMQVATSKRMAWGKTKKAQETPMSLGPYFFVSPHCCPLPRRCHSSPSPSLSPGVVVPSRCSPFPPRKQSLTVVRRRRRRRSHPSRPHLLFVVPRPVVPRCPSVVLAVAHLLTLRAGARSGGGRWRGRGLFSCNISGTYNKSRTKLVERKIRNK